MEGEFETVIVRWSGLQLRSELSFSVGDAAQRR